MATLISNKQSDGRKTSQEAGKDHHAASHLHDTYEWSRHTRGRDANRGEPPNPKLLRKQKLEHPFHHEYPPDQQPNDCDRRRAYLSIHLHLHSFIPRAAI
jgi:hypothetical protein